MNFSDAVKVAMNRSGVTKQELSESTGYSYQHIYDLLAGKRRWNEETLQKVFNALGLEVFINDASAVTENNGYAMPENCEAVMIENYRLRNQVGHLKDAIKSLTEGW
ncbi:helix-turn-helix domain-containing protein [Paenibacillus lautus]|uniref:helix-turn-helix domain-containing protein n=1 Tax=Paenibacillus lautus TaxID=1401 RepID=UPI00384DCE2B